MMRLYIYGFLALFFILITDSCSQGFQQVDEIQDEVSIIPDYKDVTIPYNISPLNFKLAEKCKSVAHFSNGMNEISVKSQDGTFCIPMKRWKNLLNNAIGRDIKITIYIRRGGKWLKYKPFSMIVAEEPIDPYLVYRKIAPVYRIWGEMGIYQRCLENFKEYTLLNNRLTNNNCMNCHSFCMQNPDKMLFHQRSTHAGTYIISGKEMEKLDTKTDQTISALVYPSWHPSGAYVAFSTNDIKQDFHASDPNRIEVYDGKSDIVLYDVRRHEIVVDTFLSAKGRMETFPAFSPDGKHLYYCVSKAEEMPESYREMKYSLLRIPFDPETRAFNHHQIDTLYDAGKEGRSAKFPRISPDGRYLMFTVSDYGNFSIWHKDADLRLLDLSDNQTYLLADVNSENTDSYHSWSSNSRWFVFSSRREESLYTRPYICHMGRNSRAGKPFLLPQKGTDFYDSLLYSFNIPEFVKGKVDINTDDWVRLSKYGDVRKVSFHQK